MQYDFHPLCLAFPAYPPDLYAERRADYERHPERADDTVVLLASDEDDGGRLKILDGRHHYLICRDLGYECSFERVEGDRDALADVALARGVNRRHQTETQIAAAVVALNEFRGRGRPENCAPVRNKTQTETAESAGISRRTVQNAVAAVKAEPALLGAMRDGAIDAKTAAAVAKLPEGERKKVAQAADPKKAAKAALAKGAKPKGKKKDSPKGEPKPTDSEPEQPPAEAADPAEEFVSRLNKLCHTLDAIKKELGEIAATPVFGAHVHRESVSSQIDAARKALWQSRPTEACNCVRAGGTPAPNCRACSGTGRTIPSRVLRGNR